MEILGTINGKEFKRIRHSKDILYKESELSKAIMKGTERIRLNQDRTPKNVVKITGDL